jgi:hypothetical protein
METATCKLTFSNPRLKAEFTDWPLGGSKRGACVFLVHRDKKGYRVSRTTTGKPKFTTYNGQACIVDGSNGRTYILQIAALYGFIKVMRSDFMDATGDMGINASVFEADAELHKELTALIVAGGAWNMVEAAK